MKRWLEQILPPLGVLLVLMAVVESVVRLLHVQRFLLPPPSEVISAIWNHREELLASLGSTAIAASIGFTASSIVGILAAIGLSASRLVQRAFYPYTVFFQTVPVVAIAPLLVIWFSAGLQSVAICAFIVSVFPVIANTLTGLLSTDPALRDLFKLYGASRTATMVKLRLPAALPNIITGLRIAAGLAVIGTIVGEFVAAVLQGNTGLGVMVLVAKRQGETDVVFAAVLMASLLGLAMFGLINLAGWLMLRRWHASEHSRE